jgi:hypothetical protein
MAATEQNNYNDLLKQAQLLISDGSVTNIRELSKKLGINRNTLMNGFDRNFGIHTYKDIVSAKASSADLIGKETEKDLEVELDGNFATIRSVIVEGQIKTVDELMALTNFKKSEWETVNPKIKKWDVALKLKISKDQEIVKVVPSIYLEVPLRAKHPTAFEPIIHPIQIDLPRLPKVAKRSPRSVKRALIINDAQVGYRRTLHTTELIPFHDRRVLDLALQIAQAEQIDHISFGGDCLDLSEWSSKFLPEPEFFWTTQPALLELAWWFTQFRLAQPTAEFKKLEGNHDKRMPNLIVQNMRQAYKLRAVDELALPPALSVSRLLALHTLQIDYVENYPDNGYWLNNNVFVTHGDLVRGNPGDTAKAITNKTAFTTIFGHIHRRESVTRRLKTHAGDLIFTAFCPGCACRIDGTVPGSKSDQQWQNGIAIIEYTEDSENIIPITISDGVMIHNGVQWTARDRNDEINAYLTKGLQETIPSRCSVGNNFFVKPYL